MPSQHIHVAALDGLRGIAILAVMLFHAFPGRFSGGFVGVDILFVLSGYLISSSLLAEWRRDGDLDLKWFLRRRLLRLGPALVLLLLMDIGRVVATGGDVGGQLLDAALIAGGVANWSLALGFDRPGVMAHTWSLAVECQFYLLWPPLLLLALRTRRRWAAPAVALGLIALCLLWRADLLIEGSGVLRGYEGLDTRCDALLLGGLLALVRVFGADTYDRWVDRLAIGGPAAVLGLALFVAAGDWTDRWLYLGGFDLVAVGAIVLVAVCLSARPTWLRLGLALPPLAALGRISYGLYLWHFPLLWLLAGDPMQAEATTVMAVLTLSTAIAGASFVWIERPALAMRRAPVAA